MAGCVQVVIPTVDETPIECTEITSTNCMQTAVAYEYFGATPGTLLTTLLTNIRNKVQTIETTTIKYTTLPIYADDAAATIAGLASGLPYKDTLGYIRYKL
jgi:hypothetical protein